MEPEAEKTMKETFGNVPLRCPACGAEFMSVHQDKDVWQNRETGKIESGKATVTIRYWCGSKFVVGPGCESKKPITGIRH